MAVEPNWLVSLNAPNAYLSLAGFEVTIIGRFWVTAEDFTHLGVLILLAALTFVLAIYVTDRYF